MKTIISIIAIFSALSVWSQQAYNTSCAAAQFLNSTTNDTSLVSFTNQDACTGSSGVNLYYYYRSNATVTGNVLSIGASLSGTSQNFTYSVYGPFSTQEEGCTYIQGSGSSLVSGSQATPTVSHSMVSGKYYVLMVHVGYCSSDVTINVLSSNLNESYADQSCLSCVKMFYPTAGNYIVSAWVRDANADPSDTTLSRPQLQITSGSTTYLLTASDQIIEGWQRIEEQVTLDAASVASISMTLKCDHGGDCYFDDIRIFPVDGSMMSYVYDPTTLRLVAELDERNYAKLYEYDEQGKLIRVKKETEKGIMTIQETRENNAGHE